MKEVLDKIGEANESQIDEIMNAAMSRKRTLYPNWDMLYLAVPKEKGEERKQSLNWVMEYLKREQEGQ